MMMKERIMVNNMGFLKGMGVGLIVGACIGMSVAPDKKFRKRQVGRAMKAVGQVIEDISDAVRL